MVRRRSALTNLKSFLLSFLLAFSAHAGNFVPSPNACEVDFAALFPDRPSLFRFDGGTESPQFRGLTEEGADRIFKIAEDLNFSDRLVNANFFAVENLMRTLRLAQVARYNVMTMGGGGGGKTGMYLFAIRDLWLKQVHEHITAMDIIGGQTKAGMDAGREQRNFEGTILRARHAMVDEGEKASPPILAMLLSIANPNERFINVGGERIDAHRLRTMIFTGNATLPEFLEHFASRGLGTTGAPFLNRFYIKSDAPNWLSEKNQNRLDQLVLGKLHARAMMKSNPDVKQSKFMLEPKDIDFESLQAFAEGAFDLSRPLLTIITTLADDMKTKTNRMVKHSQREIQENSSMDTHQFITAADYTTRLRMEFGKLIMVSAALDLLRTDLRDPDQLQKLTRGGKIVLGPASLWRLSDLLTTIGPNQNIFDPFSKKIHFGVETQGSTVFHPNEEMEDKLAKDEREETKLRHARMERTLFSEVSQNHWRYLSQAFEDAARVSGDRNFNFKAPGDFEIYLARHGCPNVKQVDREEVMGSSN